MEVARAAQILRFFAGEAFRPKGEVYEQAATGSSLYTLRRPLGVVGLITPWNFPVAIPAWKLAPALVYGNAVVLKPAQDAPLTTLHLAACLEEAGIPPACSTWSSAAAAPSAGRSSAHPLVKAISFTGSVAVGEQLRVDAAALGKRVQLELGGQNPLLVLADADLDRAVEACYAGAYWSAGRSAPRRAGSTCRRRVYDAFTSRLLERMARGVVGDPLDPATEVGPLVNESQVDEVLAGIERGRDRGRHDDRGRQARRRELHRRADAVRGRRRRRVPLVRGGLRAGRVASTVRRPGRGDRARERRPLRPLRLDLHARRRRGRRVRQPDRGRHAPRQPADGRHPTSTSRSAGSRARATARTSRAAPRSSSTPRSSRSTRTPEG